ncbi:MAG: tyrosine-type recombinase/integrase [Bryobacterales bacterium]|nr:tyrosine-type recombinase/integrase [Bryobacterales bacterium]
MPALLAAKDLTFDTWADWFLENRSRPPVRSENTHRANLEVLRNLRPVFGGWRLTDITPEAIEEYLARRLRSRRKITTKLGTYQSRPLKPSTVHRDYRVLSRILNVAVQKKRLASNPCHSVEFPARLAGSTRKPHYLTASEQARVEFFAPAYLRNVVVIMVEIGLRPYKELLPIRKEQVDMENRLVHLPDSKTASGIADMPMSERARQAFESQLSESLDSDFLFPSTRPGAKKPHLTTLKKIWASTLKRAGIEHFPLYQLRHTFATRHSAGGMADHFVTQMLRQGDSTVFKRYSQAKLGMMREALQKLDRQANEHERTFATA